MFFTHLGRVVAILVLIGATLNIVLALLVASEVIGPYEVALARYFPRKSSTGEVIVRDLYYVAVGVAFGILTEISYALRSLKVP
jgi:hypothetical protein